MDRSQRSLPPTPSPTPQTDDYRDDYPGPSRSHSPHSYSQSDEYQDRRKAAASLRECLEHLARNSSKVNDLVPAILPSLENDDIPPEKLIKATHAIYELDRENRALAIRLERSIEKNNQLQETVEELTGTIQATQENLEKRIDTLEDPRHKFSMMANNCNKINLPKFVSESQAKDPVPLFNKYNPNQTYSRKPGQCIIEHLKKFNYWFTVNTRDYPATGRTYLELLLKGFSGPPFEIIEQGILNEDSPESIIAELINNYDDSMTPLEAKRQLSTYKIEKNTKLQDHIAKIKQLANKRYHGLKDGPRKRDNIDQECIETLSMALPPKSQGNLERMYHEVSNGLLRPCNFNELCNQLKSMETKINTDIAENGHPVISQRNNNSHFKSPHRNRSHSNHNTRHSSPSPFRYKSPRRHFSTNALNSSNGNDAPPRGRSPHKRSNFNDRHRSASNGHNYNQSGYHKQMNNGYNNRSSSYHRSQSPHQHRNGYNNSNNFNPQGRYNNNYNNNRNNNYHKNKKGQRFPPQKRCGACGKYGHRLIDGCPNLVSDDGKLIPSTPVFSVCERYKHCENLGLKHKHSDCPYRPGGPLHHELPKED